MGNIAYTDKYRQRWEECQPVFVDGYFQQTAEHRLSDCYSVQVSEYLGKVSAYNIRGSECSLIDGNENVVAKWRSIDNDGDFYRVIKHRNGKDYLIFRQDLYGYSVLDISARKIMQFFSETSLNSETFIWTDVNYNHITSVLAVGGCYWACPNSTLLFSFDDPMSENQKYVDLIECFEGGYDNYDSVDFLRWNGRDLIVARYVLETKANEESVIKADEYLFWLSEKGREV